MALQSTPQNRITGGSERLLSKEWLSLQRAVALLDEHLHFALSLVEFLLARGRQANAFFKQLERFFERQVALLQLIDDGFKLLERFLK